jgi:hypothetical protein
MIVGSTTTYAISAFKQFLLHHWHSPCYSFCEPGYKSLMVGWLFLWCLKTTKYIAFSKEFNGKSMTQIGLGYLAYFDPLSYSRKDNDDDI